MLGQIELVREALEGYFGLREMGRNDLRRRWRQRCRMNAATVGTSPRALVSGTLVTARIVVATGFRQSETIDSPNQTIRIGGVGKVEADPLR